MRGGQEIADGESNRTWLNIPSKEMATDHDRVGVASRERRQRACLEKDVVFVNNGKQRAYGTAKTGECVEALESRAASSCISSCALPYVLVTI